MEPVESTYQRDFRPPIDAKRHQPNRKMDLNEIKNWTSEVSSEGTGSMVANEEKSEDMSSMSPMEKLYKKYPYLVNVLKVIPIEDMVKRAKNDKPKSTYQTDYLKKEFIPSDYFEEVMDVIREGTAEAQDNEKVCIRSQEPTTGLASDGHVCSCDIPKDSKEYGPCRCGQDRDIHQIAWKPAPISKLPRPAKKPKKDNDDIAGPKKKEAHVSSKLQSEYDGSIGKVGRTIIKKKLLSRGHNTELN